MKQSGIRIIYLIVSLLCLAYVIWSYFASGYTTNYLDATYFEKDIEPVRVGMIDEHSVEYDFEVEEENMYSMAIKFVSSHENVYLYADDRLIFERKNDERPLFGKSPGTTLNVIQLPVGITRIKIIFESPFLVGKFNSHTFEYGNGIHFAGDIIRDSIVSATISLFITFCGIVMFVFWFISRKKYAISHGTYYFALFTTLVGIWSLNETNIALFLFPNRVTASIFGYLCLCMLIYPFLQFSRHYLRLEKIKVFYWAIGTTFAGSIIVVLLHISGLRDFVQTATITHLILFLALIYVIYATLLQYKRGLKRSKMIANIIATLALLLAAGFNAVAYYRHGLQTKYMGKIGILIFVLSLGIQTMSDSFVQINEGKRADFYMNLAYSDIMTDCLNRAAIEKWQSERTSFDGITIVMCDLNDLKKCNDTFGHDAGDEYIIESSKIIKEIFGPLGDIYRMGGDEFCCVLTKKLIQPIDVYISRLRDAEEKYNSNSEKFKIQIAVGVATYKEEDGSIEETAKRADHMMYENKTTIKNM